MGVQRFYRGGGAGRGRGGGSGRGGRGGRESRGRGGEGESRGGGRYEGSKNRETTSDSKTVVAKTKSKNTDGRFKRSFPGMKSGGGLNKAGNTQPGSAAPPGSQSDEGDVEEMYDSDVESVGTDSSVDEVVLGEEEQRILDEEIDAWNANEEVEMTEAKRRIAIVNCDWDHVRPHDLFALLSHALPIGGRLISIDQYISNFGKEMIDREKRLGPDLWVKPGEEDVPLPEEPQFEELPDDEEAPESDDDKPQSDESDGWQDDNPAMMEEEGEDGEKFSKGKYRKYEIDRMKYYYCVATFDSADTAAAVYAELDGVDIEASGVELDLRYIDDEETFDEAPIVSINKLPSTFRPLSGFGNSALTQTKFRLSWDQDDIFRTQKLRKVFAADEEEVGSEDGLAAYMASSSDEDEDTRENAKREIRSKYSSLLASIGGLADPNSDEDEEESGEEQESGDEEDEEVSGEEYEDDEESDDDELNRFSDALSEETEEGHSGSDHDEESGSGEESDDDDERPDGEMEATFDMDAESKAQQLATVLKQRKMLENADVGTRAQILQKHKRKEGKKAKKEMLMEQKATERAMRDARANEDRAKLRAALGDSVLAEREHMTGKQKKKEHSKATRERIAQQRQEDKLSNIAQRLGGKAAIEAVAKRAATTPAASSGAPAATVKIDPRFGSRLAHDPRYHLDVASRGGKKNTELAQLAQNAAKERREGAGSSTSKSASIGEKRQRDSGVDADADVEYFMNRASKK